ncbi:MAG: type IV pilus assembly protein PilM [Desulfobacterales bacterium]|nr:type IV pilus assembly protein PilM [Desulfobacterales bacterium]
MAIPQKFQLIGLDIGSHSIKLAEIEFSKRGRILKNFGVIGLPPDSIVEGSIKEREIVSSAITSLYKNLRVSNKNVAFSISGYSVILKRITLSGTKESEIEKTIQDEAEQYVPFDISEVNLDFEVLPTEDEPAEDKGDEGEKQESGRLEVMLAAAKRDIINEHVGLIQVAGLNPGVLDVDLFALQNSFEISSDEPDRGYALVNVGAEELGINAIKKGVSMFTRDASYGGSQITEAIMSEFKVPFEEAEKIKLGGSATDMEKGDLEEIFQSAVSDWVREIKRALSFLTSTYRDDPIEKIVLSGGSSRIPGFREYLEQEADIPVVLLNPFDGLIINEKHFDAQYLEYMAPQAAVAVGLALRHIDDK